MAKTTAPDDKPEPNQPETDRTEPVVQPTEQLPIEPAPVSARAAASGGSTGLTNNTDAGINASLFQRHPIASGIVAGAAAVILVAGLTAWGVGTMVATSLTSSTSGMSMGAPTATPTPGAAATAPATGRQAAGRQAGGRLAFRATIQSMDATGWTILTRKGRTVTVTIDSSTLFGTKKAPETANSFAVGDSVIVVATAGKTADPAVATRVVSATDVGSDAPTTPMPGMTTPPTA
jgi:hypothetical protein